jgi:hypothetical protein
LRAVIYARPFQSGHYSPSGVVRLGTTKFVFRARDMALLAAIGVAIALVNVLLSHPESSVFHSIVEIAAWLRGAAAKPAVVTWPAWGYAWVVVWIPKFEWIITLQACLGALALVVLVRRLRLCMPKQAMVIAVLCVLAVPWHDMQVTLYPSGLAGSLLLLALLSLDTALSRNDIKVAVLAGLLMGLAQNFRTEIVLVPAFVGICAAALKHWRIIEVSSMKPMWVFILVAFILQLPWALFYHYETGRYSLTESNFGHVIYVSLGSDSSNPYRIEGNDAGAMRAVRDEGYSFSSLSEQGNQVLRRLAWAQVKLHPYGLLQRTFQQLRNTVVAPFSWGEPKLDESGTRDLDVLRQELKARLGVGINVLKLNNYRSQNLYAKAKENNAATLALLYQVGAVGLGTLVFLLGTLGMVLALVRAEARRTPLLLWFLACVALYKILQDVLLFYQVNYLNNVYPIVAISLTAIGDRLRGRASAPPGPDIR